VYSLPVPEIHHVGYVVDDLRYGVERFVQATGAGPFFAIEHIVFDEVTYRGQPAVYDHSSAFGAWGEILVELTVVHDAQPAGLRRALTAPGAGTGHVAWLVSSLREETERLRGLGLEPFHSGRTGPASAVWFDGGERFGHPVEVLEDREQLRRFYALVRAAARGWDGSEPLRVMTGPPE
jgi:Glyoxalase/Bleomycin resistance protein/Dioxygenase superfamily